MAGLIKCKECSGLISKSASSCPHCGAPGNRKTSRFTWVTLALVVVFVVVVTSGESAHEIAAKAVADQQQQDARYFKLHRDDILLKINLLMLAGDFDEVLLLANKYALSNDAMLVALQIKSEILQIKGELKDIPAADFEENRVRYGQLVELNPDSQQYKDKLAHYTKKQSAHIKRADLINGGFSVWDGSHIRLERMVKKSMNDPDSYEHAETRYFDRGDHLVVHTTFRGRNAFGGIVKQTVKAQVSLEGDVLQVLSE